MSEPNPNTALAPAHEETSMVRPDRNGATTIERVGFGTHQRETQGAALAARAQAEVQARYIIADRKPRSLATVRVRLLEHCRRPGFAARAEYAKPVGGGTVKGASIRFVETALQEYGNVLPESTITYDDDYKRVIRVSVTDLERNVTYYDDVIVEKTVERKNPKKGDEVVGSRENSYGEKVFKIRATEEDFANKAAAACSKKLRNCGLRILPADFVDEAMHVCRITRENTDAVDPKAARRALIDAFAELRVMPLDLDAYLGHSFEQASPAEMDELRAAFVAVREGEARWADLIESQRGARGEVEKPSKPAEQAASKVKDRLTALRERSKKNEKPAVVIDAAASNEHPLTEADKRAIELAEREAT